MFFIKLKYSMLYIFYDLLSDMKFLDKLPKKYGFNRTFHYDIKACTNLKKRLIVLNTQLEINKLIQSSLLLIEDYGKFDYEKTDFDKLKVEFSSQIEDVVDLENYYIALKKKISNV